MCRRFWRAGGPPGRGIPRLVNRMRTESDTIRIAHQFLLERKRDGRAFSKEEFQRVVNSDAMFDRHWLSGFFPLLARIEAGGSERFAVGAAFGGCMGKEDFEMRILGMQSATMHYSMATHGAVVNYEFFMPVTHEKSLTEALDNLFFKDTIMDRINALGLEELQCQFPKTQGESDNNYLERLCEWFGDKFGGYSMSKVKGRFRMMPLKARAAAIADALQLREPYLADEETIVVRFIFKCGESKTWECHGYDRGIDERPSAEAEFQITQDAHWVQYFFWKFFVESIIKSVNGEAEIWLVESGMRHCLHIWKRTAGAEPVLTRISESWYTPILKSMGI